MRFGVGLHKILFCCEAFVHESVIRSLPPPTSIARTIAILLHVNSAIYDAPPNPLLYAIHHTVLAMAISCQGQIGGGGTPTLGWHATGCVVRHAQVLIFTKRKVSYAIVFFGRGTSYP